MLKLATYSNLKKIVYLSQAQYTALADKDPDTVYLTPDNFQGGIYVPALDEYGNLSWSNNKGLENPPTINIVGAAGIQGPPGEKGADGLTGLNYRGNYSETAVYSRNDMVSSAQGNVFICYVDETRGVIPPPELTSNANWAPFAARGADGKTGEQGPPGPRGQDGARGAVGETGAAGPQGAQGIQGVAGPKGDKGDKGDAGEQGPQGLTGPMGIAGPKGDAGECGEQGERGPAGPQGSPGPPGRDGADGKDGKSINIKGSFPDYAALIDTHPSGAVGDGYIVNGDLYLWPDTGNDWLNTGKIQGPQGERGPQGIPGPQGPPGISVPGTAGGGSLPVGAVILALWDSPAVSSGGVEFLLMDGRDISAAEYPALFSLTGGTLPNIPVDSHGLRHYVLAYIPSGVLPVFGINDAGNLTVTLAPGERNCFQVDGRGHLLMMGTDNRYRINRESGHLEFWS